MIKKFFKLFTNLKLAILLLLGIAFFSGIGSVIEQDKEINFYQTNYQMEIKFIHLKLFELIFYFGLNHIYTTSWFFFLIFLFVLCLSSCTILQQFPTLKLARKYFFYKKINQLSKLKFQFSKKNLAFNLLLKKLNQFHYSIFQQSNNFYAYKGLIGRIAPIIVHTSIILILYGGLIGSCTGFTAQEFIPKTEIFHVQNLIKAGVITQIPSQPFRINDFWLEYNKQRNIKQFYSNISLLKGNGNEIFYKTISVNKPLYSNNLILYQTDWGVTGLRIHSPVKSQEILQLPLYEIQNLNKKIWVSWLSLLSLNSSSQLGILFLITQNQIQIYNEKGIFIDSLNINESIKLDNINLLKIIDIISSTGLQIKLDQGVFITYFGFLLLIISSLLSYISFSELWGLQFEKGIFSGAKTNRAQLNLMVEIENLKI
jgi:cytochrome c biogenesis protein